MLDVPRMGDRRGTYMFSVRISEGGKRPRGRPRHRWDDDIKANLQEVGWEGRCWIDLAKGRYR